MKTEPTVLLEAVRQLLILSTAFGLALSNTQQAAIIGAVGAIAMLGSAILAWVNRNKVYAPATVQKIADAAAVSGVPDIGTPPAG